MIHEVEVSNLMFNKTNDEQKNFKKYDINVELEEKSSNNEKTTLQYTLDLTSNPKNAIINISGSTTLSGEQSEIEKYLKQNDENTPEVVSLIYQELFPLIYIISKNMKIPSPSHTISQNTITQSEEIIENTESGDENSNSGNESSAEIPNESVNEKINADNNESNESLEPESKSDEEINVSETKINENE